MRWTITSDGEGVVAVLGVPKHRLIPQAFNERAPETRLCQSKPGEPELHLEFLVPVLNYEVSVQSRRAESTTRSLPPELHRHRTVATVAGRR
jgi:hypothetical protein